MKRIPSFSKLKARLSGFTLIELLTVIGIIAILAGVLLPAVSSALRAAKRAKAANTATSIQTAATGYYTEYSLYPIPTTAAAGDYRVVDASGPVEWNKILYALCGNMNPTTLSTGTVTGAPSNTRAISFLSIKPSDLLNNAPMNPLPPDNVQLYFNMAMDGDYDGVLGTTPASYMPNFTGTFSPTSGGTSTSGVAVWVNCNTGTKTTNPNYYVHTY